MEKYEDVKPKQKNAEFFKEKLKCLADQHGILVRSNRDANHSNTNYDYKVAHICPFSNYSMSILKTLFHSSEIVSKQLKPYYSTTKSTFRNTCRVLPILFISLPVITETEDNKELGIQSQVDEVVTGADDDEDYTNATTLTVGRGNCQGSLCDCIRTSRRITLRNIVKWAYQLLFTLNESHKDFTSGIMLSSADVILTSDESIARSILLNQRHTNRRQTLPQCSKHHYVRHAWISPITALRNGCNEDNHSITTIISKPSFVRLMNYSSLKDFKTNSDCTVHLDPTDWRFEEYKKSYERFIAGVYQDLRGLGLIVIEMIQKSPLTVVQRDIYSSPEFTFARLESTSLDISTVPAALRALLEFCLRPPGTPTVSTVLGEESDFFSMECPIVAQSTPPVLRGLNDALDELGGEVVEFIRPVYWTAEDEKKRKADIMARYEELEEKADAGQQAARLRLLRHRKAVELELKPEEEQRRIAAKRLAIKRNARRRKDRLKLIRAARFHHWGPVSFTAWVHQALLTFLLESRALISSVKTGAKIDKSLQLRARDCFGSHLAVQRTLLVKYTRVVYSELKAFPTVRELETDQMNAFNSLCRLMAAALAKERFRSSDFDRRLQIIHKEVEKKLQESTLTAVLPPLQYQTLAEKNEADQLSSSTNVFAEAVEEVAKTLGWFDDKWVIRMTRSLVLAIIRQFHRDEATRQAGRELAAARIQSLFRRAKVRMFVSAIWAEADAVLSEELQATADARKDALEPPIPSTSNGERTVTAPEPNPYAHYFQSPEATVKARRPVNICAMDISPSSFIIETSSVWSLAAWGQRNSIRVRAVRLSGRGSSDKARLLLSKLPADASRLVVPAATHSQSESPTERRSQYVSPSEASRYGGGFRGEPAVLLVVADKAGAALKPSKSDLFDGDDVTVEATWVMAKSKGKSSEDRKGEGRAGSVADLSVAVTCRLLFSQLEAASGYEVLLVTHKDLVMAASAVLVSCAEGGGGVEAVTSETFHQRLVREQILDGEAVLIGTLGCITAATAPDAPDSLRATSLSYDRPVEQSVSAQTTAGLSRSGRRLVTDSAAGGGRSRRAERVLAVTLKWECPCSNGAAVTSFMLARQVFSGSSSGLWEKLVATPALRYTDIVPHGFEQLRYRIRAQNSEGWSAYSSPPVSIAPPIVSMPVLSPNLSRPDELVLPRPMASALLRDMLCRRRDEESKDLTSSENMSSMTDSVTTFAGTAASLRPGSGLGPEDVSEPVSILEADQAGEDGDGTALSDWMDRLSRVCPLAEEISPQLKGHLVGDSASAGAEVANLLQRLTTRRTAVESRSGQPSAKPSRNNIFITSGHRALTTNSR